jgi:RNA polymerase-binding transcription factor DksA
MGTTTDIELIERLRARERELAARLERVKRDRRRSRGALDPDFAEQAVERQNDEVLDGLDVVEQRELVATRSALRRIDAGCFGICDECGGDVDPLRLEADPSVECCVRCAEAREAEQTARA